MRQTTKTTGVVIGHQLRHLPQKVEQYSGGDILTKARKIGTFLEIVVEGRSQHIRCRREDEERGLDPDENPTPDICTPIYNLMAKRYPLCSEQPLVKYEEEIEVEPAKEGKEAKKKVKVWYALK